MIKYRKGSENGRADVLSRKLEYSQDIPKNEATILQVNKDGLRLYQRTITMALKVQNDGHLEITEAQQKDTLAQRVLKDPQSYPSFDIRNGLLCFKGLIYLPETIRNEYVQRIYSLLLHGHPGVAKTAERVARDYYFPGLKRTVESIVAQCHVYKTSKSERHKLYSLM